MILPAGVVDVSRSLQLMSELIEFTSDFVIKNMFHNKKYENHAVDSAASL